MWASGFRLLACSYCCLFSGRLFFFSSFWLMLTFLLRFAGISMLMSCQFAFCSLPTVTCPQHHHYPTSWVSALLFSIWSPVFFFFFWDWGILLLSLTFCLIQAMHHLSVSVRELSGQCQKTWSVSWGMITRRVVCTLRGGLWELLGSHHVNKSFLGSF